MAARIDLHEGAFHVRTSYSLENVRLGRGIPAGRWSRPHGAWVADPFWRNVKYMRETFPDAVWSSAAKAEAQRLDDEYHAIDAPLDLSVLDAETFKNPPMEHQKRALLLGRDQPAFAYLMEQGTGKTYTAIMDACHNYRQNRIDAVIIACPNSVKSNWARYEATEKEPDELIKHMPPDVPYTKGVFIAQPSKDEKAAWADFERKIKSGKQGLVFIVVNYEALLLKRCFDWLQSVLKNARVMVVCDESTKIAKNSQRTKAAIKLRKDAKIARILTGTPVVKSPLRAYYQFGFLAAKILGFGSFYAFRNHFAVMGGFQGKQILAYKNLDELTDLIAPYSFRVTKKQCLKDLPEKIYAPPRRVEWTPEQLLAYKRMKSLFETEINGEQVIATNVLAQIVRLQQITSGYVTRPDGSVLEIIPPARNPKLKECMAIIDESPGKVIVWGRFTEELTALGELLTKAKIKWGRYDGTIPMRDRNAIENEFKFGELTVLLANAAAGGYGKDWYMAETVIFLSNSYVTEERVQAEDRAHRRDTKNSVSYYDIVIPHTEDERVLRVIRDNLAISELVTGALEAWATPGNAVQHDATLGNAVEVEDEPEDE